MTTVVVELSEDVIDVNIEEDLTNMGVNKYPANMEGKLLSEKPTKLCASGTIQNRQIR